MNRSSLAALLVLASCGSARMDVCEDLAEARDPQWQGRPTLTELWRIDGTDDGRELLLPASAALDTASGRLAILDFGLGEIIVVGTDGSWIGRWGRRGRGPGEISAAVAAAWREGSQLSVYDPANSKLVIFDSTGVGARDEPVDTDFAEGLGGGAYWILLGADGTLLAHPNAYRPRESKTSRHRIIVKRPQERVETLLETELPAIPMPGAMAVTPPGWARPQAALSPSGAVAVAGRNESYAIEIAGDSSRTSICRDVNPQPNDESEIGEVAEIPPSAMEALRAAPVPDVLAHIGRLLFDSNGRLWVQRDRPRALMAIDGTVGREGALHDVFDPSGAYLGEVIMPQRTRLLAAAGDLLIGLERDDLDVLSVVGYRISAER